VRGLKYGFNPITEYELLGVSSWNSSRKSIAALDSYNTTVGMALSTFFRHPKFRIVTYFKNSRKTHEITLTEEKLSGISTKLHFFLIFPYNKGRGNAKRCQVLICPNPAPRHLTRKISPVTINTYQPLRWARDFADGQIIEKSKLHDHVRKSMRFLKDIRGKSGSLCVVMYTVESEQKAYFTTKALLPTSIPDKGQQPAKIDVRMCVDGDNFDTGKKERYRILIQSATDVTISKLTLLDRLFDLYHKWGIQPPSILASLRSRIRSASQP
jgi:hypothetical protein